MSELQAELDLLAETGIIQKWRHGGQCYICANQDSLVFAELRSIFVKTVGVVGLLQEAFAVPRNKIDVAFIFGSIAYNSDNAFSEVDLVVIGSITPNDLALLIQPVANKLGRKIRPLLYSCVEFVQKADQKNRFIQSLLSKPLIFIKGTKENLDEMIRKRVPVKRSYTAA